EVPADVHQFDSVERGMPAPRLRGCVGALALEGVFDRHEAVAAVVAPLLRREAAVDVAEDRDVDVPQHPVADEPRFRADELLGDARPDLDRAGQPLALHDLFHREDRGDVHGLARVVPFAMPRRAFDHRRLVADARLLRRLRDAVDVRADGDDGFPAAPRRLPRSRHAADATLHTEPVPLENAGDVSRRLELLKAELAVAEDLIDELLREHGARLDVGDDFLLELLEPRVRRGRWSACRRLVGGQAGVDRKRHDGDGEEERAHARNNSRPFWPITNESVPFARLHEIADDSVRGHNQRDHADLARFRDYRTRALHLPISWAGPN